MAAKRKTKKESVKKAVSKKARAKKASTSVENYTEVPVASNGKNKRLIVTVFVVLLVLTGLYFLRGMVFAAWVNGKPISRIGVVKELEKTGGKQALDSLVTKSLIEQEAKKKNIKIGDDVINAEIERINNAVEAQGQTLDDALAQQGQTRESLEENIRVQKTVEEILKDELGVSDEELQKYFDENKEFYGENAKFDDLKEDLRAQLVQEKLSTSFQAWLDKLKSESKIIYFVEY